MTDFNLDHNFKDVDVGIHSLRSILSEECMKDFLNDEVGRTFHYLDWEQNTVTPYMENLGYTDFRWFSIREDSCGPLMRGLEVTLDEDRKGFFYG